MLGILLMSIGIIQNIYGEVFKKKKYWQFGDLTVGEKVDGFSLPMGLQISIPDTIITFKGSKHSGVVKRFASSSQIISSEYHEAEITDRVTQRLVTNDNNHPVIISNQLMINNPVGVHVNTSYVPYRIFWTFFSVLKALFILCIFVLIVKLINIYLRGDFLNRKSFKLISFIGLILIIAEVFEFVCAIVSSKIIPAVFLETNGLREEFIESKIQLNLNFGNSVSYSNIGIGLMVLILSKIIKDAVAIKKENDLTI